MQCPMQLQKYMSINSAHILKQIITETKRETHIISKEENFKNPI